MALAPLHVVFTMDCYPAATRAAPEGPRNWEQSGRSIDGFCSTLLDEGFAPTLFLTPTCADMHAPLLEDLAERGVELGLLVHPPSLDSGYKRYLGQYGREQQRMIVELAMHRFQDALGRRPLSCRSAWFSASDDTFSVCYGLGFQQGSLSNPGRRVGKHAAVWTGAERDLHYASASNRLCRGDLPFLEVPVTTDADQLRGGLAPDLAIENGAFDAWHRPLITGQLERLERDGVAVPALCLYTRNAYGYHSRKDTMRVTLDALLSYLDKVGERTDVIPSTVAAIHGAFRRLLSV